MVPKLTRPPGVNLNTWVRVSDLNRAKVNIETIDAKSYKSRFLLVQCYYELAIKLLINLHRLARNIHPNTRRVYKKNHNTQHHFMIHFFLSDR